MSGMYIRRTRTNNTTTGEAYFTHRLVRGERIAGKVRQITVLNLGRHFPILQQDWPLLCRRIEEILCGQQPVDALSYPEHIEEAAQRYAGRMVVTAASVGTATPAAPDFQELDVDSAEDRQPRSVGVEWVGLHALSQLRLVEKLTELGINGAMRAAIIGSVIGRMAKPGSELATWKWLQQESALGEMMDFDFSAMSLIRLYRASDVLMKHRAVIEEHLYSSLRTLFALEETVTLYDLTNTYFEGDGEGNELAQRGVSKEKRSDCPMVTLGLVLDGSGFVRRSRTFAGNVFEGHTLQAMLAGLGAPAGALVILDAGIATEANLLWLVEQGYRYLVVRRSGARQFDAAHAVSIETASGDRLRLQKELSADGKEVLLYCHSEGRALKEAGMVERFGQIFEAGLQKIADGLLKPRGEKNHSKLLMRMGRLKEKSRGAARHYQVDLVADAEGKKAIALTWTKVAIAGSMATHPGVYCLRSNELTWDEEKLWRTYTMLTELESVFRSLKSELGLRPVFHSTQERADGHLFITVLAYQCVQVLRTQLRSAEIRESWSGLRAMLGIQRRTTTSFRRRDGRALHLRKTSQAEPELMKLYRALAIDPSPIGVKKMVT